MFGLIDEAIAVTEASTTAVQTGAESSGYGGCRAATELPEQPAKQVNLPRKGQDPRGKQQRQHLAFQHLIVAPLSRVRGTELCPFRARRPPVHLALQN